jgi:DnaK suppressor protein
MPRAQKADGAHQAPAKKATQSHGSTAKHAAKDAPKKEPAKKAAAKTTAKSTTKTTASTSKEASKTPAKAAKTTKAATKATGEDAHDKKFLDEQRELLLAEREDYVQKAEELKAEADSLARETEPGDIQFDEEGGEGGTASIDREVDLVLSAQARAAVEEIDRALHKIELGTYGICESCNQPIPKARLKALPYAALCVQCKSGGLSRR